MRDLISCCWCANIAYSCLVSPDFKHQICLILNCFWLNRTLFYVLGLKSYFKQIKQYITVFHFGVLFGAVRIRSDCHFILCMQSYRFVFGDIGYLFLP